MPAKLTLDHVRAFAEGKGLTFLDDAYVGNKFQHRWRCEKGHGEFNARQNDVDQQSGCPKCGIEAFAATRRSSLDFLHALAKKNNGLFLDEQVYKNCGQKVSWRCAKGHDFKSSANQVQQKEWCPRCAGTVIKTLEEIQAAAQARGGACLSTECKNSRDILQWVCAAGHEFSKDYHGVMSGGRWCPVCAETKNSTAETVFFAFVKGLVPEAISRVRGVFGNRGRKGGFELDVYIPSMNKAIEFDGDFWHSSPEAQERDRRKDEACRAKGIELLRVSFRRWSRKRASVKQEVRAFLGV
jgi:hypothetical protein